MFEKIAEAGGCTGRQKHAVLSPTPSYLEDKLFTWLAKCCSDKLNTRSDSTLPIYSDGEGCDDSEHKEIFPIEETNMLDSDNSESNSTRG